MSSPTTSPEPPVPELSIHTTRRLADDDRLAVIDGLVEYNRSAGFVWEHDPLNVVARAEGGRIIGGLLGEVNLGWVFVAALWVDSAHRGSGVGSALVRAAEAEARERGCTGIYLDTYSFQARPFYERLGFELFGELADCPPGGAKYYLRKRLDSPAVQPEPGGRGAARRTAPPPPGTHPPLPNPRSSKRVPDDRELMRLHVETLFTHDAAGRMLRVNEPQGKEAPRFFLGRTAHGNVWRFRHDLDDGLVRELEAACTALPVGGEAPASTAYEELLARAAPVQRSWAGPAYAFPEELPEAPDAVLVSDENAGLLRPHLEAWLGDVPLCRPMLAVLSGGRAVALCCSVRATSAAHEAGVETAPGFRGRGYAAQAVAAWARAVRGAGRIPLYSTSWENTASRSLARRLGLRRYGADLHVT